MEEARGSIKCRARRGLPLGTNDMFIGEVVNVEGDGRFLDESGRFALERARLIGYAHGEYFRLGKAIGRFGWSVRKKKKGSATRKPVAKKQK